MTLRSVPDIDPYRTHVDENEWLTVGPEIGVVHLHHSRVTPGRGSSSTHVVLSVVQARSLMVSLHRALDELSESRADMDGEA